MVTATCAVLFLSAIQLQVEPVAMAQGRIDTIAASGDIAPDGNGSFSAVFAALLNDNGNVAFGSSLSGTAGGNNDNVGIFIGDGTGVSQLFRAGQMSPDGNGTVVSPSLLSLNNSDQICSYAFLSGTSGGSTDNAGLYLVDSGSAMQVVGKGQSVPGGNGAFNFFFYGSQNSLGQVGFQATLSGTSGGTSDDRGLYFWNPNGTITQIAREGQAAPDGNGVFSFLGETDWSDSGYAVFNANLSGTTGGSADNRGIFRGNGTTVEQIARAGQAAPGGNGNFSQFSAAQHNNSNQIAFQSDLVGTAGGSVDNSGIFRWGTSGIVEIARAGQATPDGNGIYAGFEDERAPAINDAGHVAFLAQVTGTSGGSADGGGIFVGDGTNTAQIARKGQAVPTGGASFSNFYSPTINESGQVLFRAGVTQSNGSQLGIYTGEGIDLFEIARTGTPLAGSTIAFFYVEANGALNQHGQIAYTAELNNGKTVIQRWTPDLHWREAGSGMWDSGNNWTLSLNPAFVHDVYIDSSVNANVLGPAGDVTVRNLQVGGGSGDVNLQLQNTSVLSAIDGVSIASNGVLSGNGTIVGNVFNEGTIAPGMSAGTLTFEGDVELTDTSVLSIELGGFTSGSEFDAISVTGELDLDGLLEISFINGFENSITGSDMFTIISANTLNGTFANTIVNTSNGFGSFQVSYVGNSIVLSNFTAVPEPMGAGLLVVGIVGLASTRRRRK